MESEDSIPNSQELSTFPYPEPDKSVHITPSHLYKIHPNIIQPPTSWSSWWPPSLWLSHQQPIRVPLLPYSCYMPRLSNPPRLNYSNNTWRRVQIMKFFILQFSPFSCHLISLRPKYPPQHSVLKHPRSSLNFRDQVLHPYRTTGKIIVLHILIFKLFDSNREYRRF
jgi:hypothetical protein